MDRRKKKSRALIITFIVMFIILFVFYLLVIKNDPLGTRGTQINDKDFQSQEPGTKNGDLDTIDNTDNGNTTNLDNNDGQVISGNIIDDDNGGDINTSQDPEDPNYDIYDPQDPKLSPIPRPDIEDRPTPNVSTPRTTTTTIFTPPTPETTKQCNFDDYKLKFTDAEQEELDKLLREFYKIASSIKTEDDINAENEAKLSYIGLVDEARDLTTQCYEQTNSPTYLSNFDWTNSLFEQEFSDSGNLLSVNYSRVNEARTERKPNPWFNLGGGYFYNADIVQRSARFSRTPKDYRMSGAAYYNTIYTNNLTSRQACIAEANAKAKVEQSSLPNGYTVSYKCNIFPGQLKSNYYTVKSALWYPTVNWNNTSGSDIDPNEWYLSESVCEQRSPVCTRPFQNTPEKDDRVPDIDWAYSITVRSPSFSNLKACEDASKKATSFTNAKCTGGEEENAYIFKNWSQLTNDGTGANATYVAPIDYAIFERLFSIW